MKYIPELVNIALFYFISLLFNKVYAENSTIQIFIDKPDSLTENAWNDYSIFMDSQEFQVNANGGMKNVKVHFNYNPFDKFMGFNKENYINYYFSLVNKIKESTYDMLIVDDKFLFGEYTYIKSEFISNKANIVDFHENYIDLTNIIKKEDLSFHNKDILSRCYLEDHLYALPFEMDFDVVYSRNANIQSELEFKTWKDLLTTMNQGGNLLSIPYGEKSRLLDFFIEYVESEREYIYNDEANNLDIFYNDKAKYIYDTFKNFITKSSPKNIPSSLNITLNDAYESFKSGESALFLGKASLYRSITKSTQGAVINNNQTASQTVYSSLPPRGYNVINPKYLIINKNSKIDTSILVEVAKQLTSPEMQLVRVEKLGSAPTFNIDDNKSAGAYCQSNAEICGMIKNMKSINIKNIFKCDNCATFTEVDYFVPIFLKDYIMDQMKIDELTSHFNSIKYFCLLKPDYRIYVIFFIYIPTIIGVTITIVLAYYTYKYRNHSSIKYLSPGFCIIIYVALILNIVAPVVFSLVTTVFIGRLTYIFETVNTILFFLPMMMVTYRIYTIYTNTSNYLGNKLDNRHLYIYFTIIFIIWISYAIIVSIFSDFQISYESSIDSLRSPYYNFSWDAIERVSYRVYYFICMGTSALMVAKLGIVKKQYGAFKFVFFMFFAYASSSILNRVIRTFDIGNIITVIISNLIVIIAYTSFSYFLLGKKLIRLIRTNGAENDNATTVKFYNLNSNTLNVANKSSYSKSNNRSMKSNNSSQVDSTANNMSSSYYNYNSNSVNNYTGSQNNYTGSQNNYTGNQNNYTGSQNNYTGSKNNHSGSQNNYSGSQNNYTGNQNNFKNSSQNSYITNTNKTDTTVTFSNPTQSMNHDVGSPSSYNSNFYRNQLLYDNRMNSSNGRMNTITKNNSGISGVNGINGSSYVPIISIPDINNI